MKVYNTQSNKRFATNGNNFDLDMDIMDLSDIVYFKYNSGEATIFLVDGQTISDTQALEDVEKELSVYGFCRIDKNTIINAKYITEINTDNEKYFVKFADIEKKISASVQKELKEMRCLFM